MSKELFSGPIDIFYGQFYIDDPDREDEYVDMNEAFHGQTNGWCGAAQKEKLFVVVSPQDGAVDLRMELCDEEPQINEDYEDVVECAFSNATNNLHIREWGDEAIYKVDLPKGDYICRYSIKGADREIDYDGPEESFEKPIPGQYYLIQFWPGTLESDKIIRSESGIGKYWHRERENA